MKIDENCINHNALRLINDESASAFDISFGEKDSEILLYGSIQYIYGVCKMAESLKEVLKA